MTEFTKEEDLIKPKYLTYLKRRADFLLFVHQLKHDFKIDISKGVRVTDTKFSSKSFNIVFKQLYEKLYTNYEIYETYEFSRKKHMIKLWNTLHFLISYEDLHTNNLKVWQDQSYVKTIFIKYKGQVEYYSFDWDNYTVEFTAMKNG